MEKKNNWLNVKLAFFPMLLFLVSCRNRSLKDATFYVPVNKDVNMTIVNHTDENGRKQGLWQEVDTINHRITQEFYYKDNILDSSYLIYKNDSPDTLVFGYYKSGEKEGEWKYWDTNSNKINKIEFYEDNILKETKKYAY